DPHRDTVRSEHLLTGHSDQTRPQVEPVQVGAPAPVAVPARAEDVLYPAVHQAYHPLVLHHRDSRHPRPPTPGPGRPAPPAARRGAPSFDEPAGPGARFPEGRARGARVTWSRTRDGILRRHLSGPGYGTHAGDAGAPLA